jgi:phosphoribosylformylglycinamidine cyclo-ligase
MPRNSKSLTYSKVGDDYEKKDRCKRIAIEAAISTAHNLKSLGFSEVSASRGESTHVIDIGDCYLASNPEGLGTKNLIADEVARSHPNKTFYREIAQDTVASIVNDVITLGARPLVVSAHWSMGDNEWMRNEPRWKDLVEGWRDACNEAGAIYGAGESPTLKGLVRPVRIELSGSVMGIIDPKERLTIGNKLQVGDHIILVESNGLQSNGASLVRRLAQKLPKKYDTLLPTRETLGEALLHPSHIYARLQEKIFKAGIDIHYMVHLTGHGWSKLMRYDERNFTYRITTLPDVQEEFRFLQKVGKLSDQEMYGTFNMGAGYGFYVSPKDVKAVQRIAKKLGFKSWDAGVVEKGERQVIIEPLNLTYGKETLNIR